MEDEREKKKLKGVARMAIFGKERGGGGNGKIRIFLRRIPPIPRGQ